MSSFPRPVFNRDPRTPMRTHVGPHIFSWGKFCFLARYSGSGSNLRHRGDDNDNNADDGIPTVDNPSIVTYLQLINDRKTL